MVSCLLHGPGDKLSVCFISPLRYLSRPTDSAIVRFRAEIEAYFTATETRLLIFWGVEASGRQICATVLPSAFLYEISLDIMTALSVSTVISSIVLVADGPCVASGGLYAGNSYPHSTVVSVGAAPRRSKYCKGWKMRLAGSSYQGQGCLYDAQRIECPSRWLW